MGDDHALEKCRKFEIGTTLTVYNLIQTVMICQTAVIENYIENLSHILEKTHINTLSNYIFRHFNLANIKRVKSFLKHFLYKVYKKMYNP